MLVRILFSKLDMSQLTVEHSQSLSKAWDIEKTSRPLFDIKRHQTLRFLLLHIDKFEENPIKSHDKDPNYTANV